MDKLLFRPLRADEIEVRLSRCSQKGAFFLLYKDARCDMNILDETVGPLHWQRAHAEHRGNLFCSVAINAHYRDAAAPPCWVWKEDAGSESNTEAEKGHASDSFKRACFNWGIGRELYTKINIFVPGITKDSGKTDGRGKPVYVLSDSFYKLDVRDVAIENGKITRLELADKDGMRAFYWQAGQSTAKKAPDKSGSASRREGKLPGEDYPEPEHVTVLCADCNQPITDWTDPSGKRVSAERMRQASLKSFGVSLCGGCAQKRGGDR